MLASAQGCRKWDNRTSRTYWNFFLWTPTKDTSPTTSSLSLLLGTLVTVTVKDSYIRRIRCFISPLAPLCAMLWTLETRRLLCLKLWQKKKGGIPRNRLVNKGCVLLTPAQLAETSSWILSQHQKTVIREDICSLLCSLLKGPEVLQLSYR